MTLAAPAECARTALTHAQIDFERFANPFCDKQREVKARGKHGPYCSAPCGMDGYALRRGRALLKKGRHHPFSPTADPLFLPRDLWQGCYHQAHHKASDADGHDCGEADYQRQIRARIPSAPNPRSTSVADNGSGTAVALQVPAMLFRYQARLRQSRITSELDPGLLLLCCARQLGLSSSRSGRLWWLPYPAYRRKGQPESQSKEPIFGSKSI
jgi:hypothetical protein